MVTRYCKNIDGEHEGHEPISHVDCYVLASSYDALQQRCEQAEAKLALACEAVQDRGLNDFSCRVAIGLIVCPSEVTAEDIEWAKGCLKDVPKKALAADPTAVAGEKEA